MPNLCSDVWNTLRTKQSCLKVIIIDEISMVGSKILSQVNNRLKAIMDNSLDFGGDSSSLLEISINYVLLGIAMYFKFQSPVPIIMTGWLVRTFGRNFHL